MADLVKNMKMLNINGCNCHKDIKRETVYFNLNDYQKIMYDQISGLLKNDKSKVILIDAPSGTGKTFLLSTLAAAHKQNTKFLTFRKDQASDLLLKNVDSYTYVSFSMRYFNFNYFRAIHMYDICGGDAVDILYELIVYSKIFNSQDTNTIILDSYTIPPPTMLLLLYILSIKSGIHLIFVGDNLQLGPINKSRERKGSNHSLIQMLKDTTMESLPWNARICDPVLKTNISCFRNIILQYQFDGNLKFRFDLQYSLYKLFRSKYFTEERFDTVYIAQLHKQIKARMFRFEKYLESISKSYVKAPFHYKNNDGKCYPFLPKVGKFSSYIILVEGYKYIHITSEGVHRVVYLDKIVFVGDIAETLKLRFVNDNDVIEVKRTKLSYAQVLPAHRKWLLKNHLSTELYQFPLRQYALTYHAALGRTIENDQVELDVDCVNANHAYIGLNCVRHNFDIHKIHNERSLLSYVATEYMETKCQDSEYYYRCPATPLTDTESMKILEHVSNQGVNKFIENIDWLDVDINIFEKKSVNRYVRTKRSYYQQSKEEVATPSLTQSIAKFMKEKPIVICNAIRMATAEDNFFTGKVDKKKKKKGKGKEKESDKERPVIAYLKEEYGSWIDAEEKKRKE